MKKHLVIIGFDEIVFNKYLELVIDAINTEVIDSYSIIDLEEQEINIQKQISKLRIKPIKTCFLKTQRSIFKFKLSIEFEKFIKGLKNDNFHLKVYIATEVRSHEYYLKYCIDNDIDSLVEKPIFCPIHNDSYAANLIEPTMNSLLEKSLKNKNSHSVMTLSRYHKIYNELYLSELRKKILLWQTPVTSFHIRASGGVWNLNKEYDEREDHPYKYGYGMIMHGAYHYVDLAAQAMLLNRLIYPKVKMEICLSSYCAFPQDQSCRIRGIHNDKLEHDNNYFEKKENKSHSYGETDIVSSFSIKNIDTQQVLMLGTLSFEQTTPSIRNWVEFPEGVYNKNGRTSFVELETQLSTLHTSLIQCYDLPLGKHPDKIDAYARILNRTNASIITDEEYISEKEYSGLFHNKSNKKLMKLWLLNQEVKSEISTHKFTMQLISLLSKSVLNPGIEQSAIINE
jgi:hypothetical protein